MFKRANRIDRRGTPVLSGGHGSADACRIHRALIEPHWSSHNSVVLDDLNAPVPTYRTAFVILVLHPARSALNRLMVTDAMMKRGSRASADDFLKDACTTDQAVEASPISKQILAMVSHECAAR
jgi:hypothetical protein